MIERKKTLIVLKVLLNKAGREDGKVNRIRLSRSLRGVRYCAANSVPRWQE
jgi:hypothetical protein